MFAILFRFLYLPQITTLTGRAIKDSFLAYRYWVSLIPIIYKHVYNSEYVFVPQKFGKGKEKNIKGVSYLKFATLTQNRPFLFQCRS